MKARHFTTTASLLAAITLTLTAPGSHAAALTWDTTTGDGAAVTAGTGAWNTTAGNLVWNDGTTPNVIWSQTSTTVPTNSATFAGTDGAADAYVVTLDVASSQMAASSLTFNSTGYKITGNIIYLPQPSPTSTPTITVAAGKTATINSTIKYPTNVVMYTTVGAGATLNLGGGYPSGSNYQPRWIGAGTINMTGGSFQSNTTILNAAQMNQSTSGTVSSTYQIWINNNANQDVSYTISGGILSSNASQSDRDTSLVLGHTSGNYTGRFTVKTGGTVNIGTTTSYYGYLAIVGKSGNGNGVLDVQGGNLTVGTGRVGNQLYFFKDGANAGKTATMTQSGGTVTAQGIQFGNNTTGTYDATAGATLQLTGGNLYVGSLGITRGSAATALPISIQLSGGTVGATTANWSSSLDMKLGTSGGGVTFLAADSVGTARNIALSGILANDTGVDGTLTKTGGGTLTLSGANIYTGPTTVSVGEIKHSTTGSATTDITVAASATNGVLVAAADGQWVSTKSLTHANNSSLRVDFGLVTPSMTVAPMKVSSLALGTGMTMRIDGLVSGFLPGQTLPLVTWTGSGPADGTAFTTVALPTGISGTLGVSGNTLSLTVTGNTSLLAWNKGDGAWDILTPNWVSSSLAPATYADTVNAVMFGDAGDVTGNPTVTLNDTFSPLGLLMKSTSHDYTINGTGTIAGSGALILDATNTRTLTLANANNTFTGNTAIGGGTLQLGGASRLGGGSYAGSISIANGATFENAGTGNQTLSGAITGPGGTLKLSADGQLILTNAGNTYGALSIGNGRIFISSNAAALPPAATVSITGGILVFGTGTSYGNPITVGSGGGIATRNSTGTTLANITLPGTGTVIFNNDDATTRALTIASGQTLTGTLTVEIGGNRTTANAVGGVTMSGKLTGEGALTLASPGLATGVLTLTGPNDYAGKTTINSGTLSINTIQDAGSTTANALGLPEVGANSIIDLGDTGTLKYTGTGDSSNRVVNLAALTGGTMALDASGASGTFELTGGVTSAGTDGISTLTLTGSGLGSESAAITDGTSPSVTALTKNGTGTWTLTGANTYTGATTLSAGVLRANDNAGLPGLYSAGGGSSLNLAGGVFETGLDLERASGSGQGQMQITGGTSGFSAYGAPVQVAFGTLASPDALSWDTVPFSPGTFVLNAATASNTIDFKNAVDLGDTARTVRVDANVATMSGLISSTGTTGGLTKTGTGILTLSNANTYTGVTTVNAGTLKAGIASVADTSGAFGKNSAVSMANDASAVLDITGFDTQIGSLTGGGVAGGNVTLGANTLTVGGDNINSTYGGAISSTGTPMTSLIKIGTNYMTLTGANTYTGVTTVNAGSLVIASATANSPNTSFVINGNAGGGGQLYGGWQIPGATFANNLTISGLGISEGGILVGAVRASNNQTFSGAITLAADSRIAMIETTAAATFSGKITGGFALDVQGAFSGSSGTQTFTLANPGTASDYSGNTTISAVDYGPARTGAATILRLGAAEQLPNGFGKGNVVFNGANADHLTVLELNGFNETLNGLSNAAAAGAIIRNTSTGASVLTIGDADTTGSIFSGVITDGGAGKTLAVTKIGTGTLTLSGANSYSGNTTVNAGTLTLSNAPDAANANPGNDASTVTIAATGAALDLTYTGTDKVDKLFIGTTQMPAGVYGAGNIIIPQITNSTGTGTLTVLTGPNFALWITGSFVNGSVPSGQQGPNHDPDNDGIPNLVEYAIAGQDPTVANATIGTFTANTLSFTKRADATGLTYAIVESTDLGLADDWTEVTGGSYTNSPSTISYTLTPGSPVKNFIRLKVTQP